MSEEFLALAPAWHWLTGPLFVLKARYICMTAREFAFVFVYECVLHIKSDLAFLRGEVDFGDFAIILK